MTLARFTATELGEQEIQKLISAVLEDFSRVQGLLSIVLFGSAVTGQMTSASDLDVILIFQTKEEVKDARKAIPVLRKKAIWPMDLLCVDVETFKAKSAIGGVYYLAKSEGKAIFGPMP